MTTNAPKRFTVDWQHFALILISIGLAGLEWWKPLVFGPYAGPVLVLLVGAGIFKYSPVLGPGSKPIKLDREWIEKTAARHPEADDEA